MLRDLWQDEHPHLVSALIPCVPVRASLSKLRTRLRFARSTYEQRKSIGRTKMAHNYAGRATPPSRVCLQLGVPCPSRSRLGAIARMIVRTRNNDPRKSTDVGARWGLVVTYRCPRTCFRRFTVLRQGDFHGRRFYYLARWSIHGSLQPGRLVSGIGATRGVCLG